MILKVADNTGTVLIKDIQKAQALLEKIERVNEVVVATGVTYSYTGLTNALMTIIAPNGMVNVTIVMEGATITFPNIGTPIVLPRAITSLTITAVSVDVPVFIYQSS